MKKFLALTLAVVMVLSLAACGSSSSTTATTTTAAKEEKKQTYEWKMALNSTAGDNAYDTGAAFKQKIEELTNGQVKVTLYGGAALGSTTEVLEGMKVGVADCMVESVGTLSGFSKLANIEPMPYAIQSYDHFIAVWHGTVGDEIKKAVGDDAGFALLGGTYRGPRIVTATKKMTTIDEFKGFKLRAPNIEMYIKTWEWLKAAPTPMSMNEVYTALQQKTVDGQENPMVDSYNYKFNEVCNYWIKTNHVFGCNVIIFDNDYFNALPADIQAACKEAAEYAGKTISEQQANKEAETEKQLKSEGKEVIEVDVPAFAKYFEDFASTNYPEFADWVKKIADANPNK